jgi:hypothetical protein
MNDPMPVQSLQYGTESSRDPWRVTMRAIGMVLVVVGGVEALNHGFAVVSSLARWADPFGRRSSFSGRPSPDWLMAISMVACLGGIVATVGGIGCMSRRPRARWTVLSYAITEIIWRAGSAAAWTWIVSSMQTNKNIDYITSIASQLSYSLTALAMPALLIVLVKQQRLWERAALSSL